MSGDESQVSLRTFELTNCYLCSEEGVSIYSGLEDRHLGVRGSWDLLRCRKCGLIWLTPQPEPEEVSKLYGEAYYTHSSEEVIRPSPTRTAKGWLLNLMTRSAGARDANLTGVRRLMSSIGPLREIADGKTLWLGNVVPGSLLDVGCGNGTFLLRMEALGWNVQGIEPDPLAAMAAAGKGLRVRTTTLEMAGYPEDSFDFITMSHVIEHVPDPIRLLKECRRVLKKGGELILLTPNTGSLARRIFGFWWYGWEPPRHLMLFTPQVLKRCVDEVGLVTTQATTSARSARGMWQGSYLLRKKQAIGGANHLADAGLGVRLGGLVFWGVEHLVSRWAGVGEEVRIHAQRID